MLAEPPKAALLFGVLQTNSLPPSPAPTATGWSDSCRAGFAPAEEWRLSTAHVKDGLITPPPGERLPCLVDGRLGVHRDQRIGLEPERRLELGDAEPVQGALHQRD